MSTEETVDSLELTLRPVGGDTRILRSLLLGDDPMILMEFVAQGDDGIVFKIDATGPEDRFELADMLEGVADLIREPLVTA